MAKFFINRPIVAIVISIILVIVGIVALLGLPIAQYPNIVPPEILVNTTYVGADAQTVEQSVATPIEQEMSGVDNMNYMYSLNANNGEMKLYVNFDVKTDPNIDQVLTQMRQSPGRFQAAGRRARLRRHGQEVHGRAPDAGCAHFAQGHLRRHLSGQLRLHQLERPDDPRAGHRQRHACSAPANTPCASGSSPTSWPSSTSPCPEIVDAIQKQNTVNPAGQVGAEPAPPGQEYTYAIRAQGRLESPEEFEKIVLRANPDGSLVRLKDVARIELGSQTYSHRRSPERQALAPFWPSTSCPAPTPSPPWTG